MNVHPRSVSIVVLRLVGALLILLGIVHLLATSHIPELLRGSSPAVYAWAIGPTLLKPSAAKSSLV
jgi:hypothetical protein